MSQKRIISSFQNKQTLNDILQANTGILIIKFTAKWCNPCRKIKPMVDHFFLSSPDNVICADLDIDDKDNQEIYLFFKKFRVVSGVPTILMYLKGNTSIFPNDSFSGSNINELNQFFSRTKQQLYKMSNVTLNKENSIV